MRIVDVDPINDRQGWLTRRREGLGGSDVAKVLDISKWGSPWSVYVDKIGAVDLDADPTEQQLAGRYLEAGILAWYADHTGLTVAYEQAMIVHPEHDWAFCTVDGLVFEGPADDPDVAIKGVDAKHAAEWSWDRVPLDYQAQAQWSMLVTGLPEWDLAVAHPSGFRVYTVEADHTDQKALLSGAERFWREHVLAGVPPPETGLDNALLAQVWPEGETGKAEDIDDLADTVAELVAVKAEQKRLQKRRDELEAALKNRLGDAEVGLIGGKKAISWGTQWRADRFDEDAFAGDNPFLVHRFKKTKEVEYLDIDAIKEEEPELYRKFTRPTRRFLTHVKPEE